jgi:hypothetical protein
VAAWAAAARVIPAARPYAAAKPASPSAARASNAIRGSTDYTVHDAADVEREARAALGDAGFAAAYRRAAGLTMATAAEAAKLDPAPEGPYRERGEGHQQDGRPDQ